VADLAVATEETLEEDDFHLVSGASDAVLAFALDSGGAGFFEWSDEEDLGPASTEDRSAPSVDGSSGSWVDAVAIATQLGIDKAFVAGGAAAIAAEEPPQAARRGGAGRCRHCGEVELCCCLDAVALAGIVVALRPKKLLKGTTHSATKRRRSGEATRSPTALAERQKVAVLVDQSVANAQPFMELARALERSGRPVVVVLLNRAAANAAEAAAAGSMVLCVTGGVNEALAAFRPALVLHSYQARHAAQVYEQRHGSPAVMVGFDRAYACADYPPRPSLRVRNKDEARVAAKVLDDFISGYLETSVWEKFLKRRGEVTQNDVFEFPLVKGHCARSMKTAF